MGTSKNPFERKRATCTDSCVKPPHRAPARFRSLSLHLAPEQDALTMPPEERKDALLKAA